MSLISSYVGMTTSKYNLYPTGTFPWVFFTGFYNFSVAETILGIFDWCQNVWPQTGPCGLFKSGRLEDPFLNNAGFALILSCFLRFSWFFMNTLMLSSWVMLLSNAVMFHYGSGLLVYTLISGRFKDLFLNTARISLILLKFFRFSWVISQAFNVF